MTNNLNKLMNLISAKTGILIIFYAEEDGVYIYDVQIGTSYIVYDNNTGIYQLHMIYGDESPMYPVVKTKNVKDFVNKAVTLINRASIEHPFECRKILENVANKIGKATGLDWKYIGVDNKCLTILFGNNIAYMCNGVGGTEVLKFVLNLGKEKEALTIYGTDENIFIHKVIDGYKKIAGKRTTRNKYIANEIYELIKNKRVGTVRIYKDNCWWADIEVNELGNWRVWVGYEDKRSGKANGSLFTIYDLNTKSYGCGFKVKEAVKNKIFSVCKVLDTINN